MRSFTLARLCVVRSEFTMVMTVQPAQATVMATGITAVVQARVVAFRLCRCLPCVWKFVRSLCLRAQVRMIPRLVYTLRMQLLSVFNADRTVEKRWESSPFVMCMQVTSVML